MAESNHEAHLIDGATERVEVALESLLCRQLSRKEKARVHAAVRAIIYATLEILRDRTGEGGKL